jgi:predicted chitinase
MEKKLFISLLGTLLLLAYPNDCSPESSASLTTEIILQSLDSGDLSEEQLALLREELEIYQQSCEPLIKTDLEAWKKKLGELFRKLAHGFRIYNLAQKNPELKSKADEFTGKTNIQVYILSYVEDAFLNNIFQRLAEARYDVIQKAHVKMKYKFKKSSTDSSSLYTAMLDLVYDSTLVDLLKAKLAKDYTDYSDLTLEASANKVLQKAGIQDIYSDAASTNTALDPTAEDILDKLASTNVEATIEEDYLSVMICDSLVKNEKIYYWKKDCLLKVKMDNRDTVNVKEINLGLTINISNSKKDQSFSFVMKDFNQWKTLKLDSLPEGKYMLKATINRKAQGKTFYLRKNKPDYACAKCGRDLTVTLERLSEIFEDNNDITSTDAKLFNLALKKGGFNTCKKQIHFFSQIKHESANFTSFREDTYYSLPGYLKTFFQNCNVKEIYNQSFWENKTYKEFFFYEVYELDTLSTAKKQKAKGFNKYEWNPKICKTVTKEQKDTISIPISFVIPSKKEIGNYVKISYTSKEKEEIGKKLFSLTYANMYGNGNSTSQDGYKYMGKGTIQLTFKDNYKAVGDIANQKFGTSFNWVINYDDVADNREAIIYSSAAYFIYRLGSLDKLDNSNVSSVSNLVNGGTIGLKERIKCYNDIIEDNLYDCTIPKE